jgi:hypothetical protein
VRGAFNGINLVRIDPIAVIEKNYSKEQNRPIFSSANGERRRSKIATAHVPSFVERHGPLWLLGMSI